MALKHGKEWNGFNIVEGRYNSKLSDRDAVAAAKKHICMDIYRQSLITLTEMQKLMGKNQLEEIMGGLVIKPPRTSTLVPLLDKRQAMKVLDAKNEFNKMMED